MSETKRNETPAAKKAKELVSQKPWKDFHVFHQKWPHWRAEDVLYWVWFRHTRTLKDSERAILFKNMISRVGKSCEIFALCVAPGETHLLLCQNGTKDFAQLIVTAKRKAGKAITDATSERFPPYYEESFDRIVRDVDELNEIVAKMGQLDPKREYFLEV